MDLFGGDRGHVVLFAVPAFALDHRAGIRNDVGDAGKIEEVRLLEVIQKRTVLQMFGIQRDDEFPDEALENGEVFGAFAREQAVLSDLADENAIAFDAAAEAADQLVDFRGIFAA